jgi:hypothetical protein
VRPAHIFIGRKRKVAIDSLGSGFREISGSAVSQSSVRRRDQELQVEDGQPPLEVPLAELPALHGQNSDDFRERWKKNGKRRSVGGQQPREDDLVDCAHEETEAQSGQLDCETSIEEETGNLFDDRL